MLKSYHISPRWVSIGFCGVFQPTGTGDRGNLLPQRIFCSPSVGCRHVRPVRQLGVNLPKTAGQKHKKYPRFQVEIGGISFHLFPQVAGGFAFLPYAAILCGTQRMEIRRFKITFRPTPTQYEENRVSSISSRLLYAKRTRRHPAVRRNTQLRHYCADKRNSN